MAENRNYYEILGIPDSAGRDEIRGAYRRLAFMYHPDRKNDADAQIFFQQVIEAFSVLSDPDKRAEYDAILFDDSPFISSPLSEGVQSADDLYNSVARQSGARRVSSERERYLRHLESSRRRRTTVQTTIALVLILLLSFFGFKPLKTSTESVAPSTTNSGNSSQGGSNSTGGQSNNSGSNGSSLNQNLIVIQGPAGADGVAGPAGRDGRIGVDGVPGVAGPAGAPGQDGAAGPAGPAGSAGAPGAPGVAGAAGADGTPGRDGQDATVYTVRPNIGSLAGSVSPCNQDLNDTSTAPSLGVTISPYFDSVSGKYKLSSINLSGFTAACRGASVQINIKLASDATSNANAEFECTYSPLPSNLTAPFAVSFNRGTPYKCRTSFGTWGVGTDLDLGTIVASDLAKINLIVTG